jgi:HEAT repeat protein
MRLSRLALPLLSALLLAGCEDMFSPTPSRDFNELIPRMMGAINKGTPEENAAALSNVTSPDERRDAIAYLQTRPWGHEPAYMRAYELLTTDPHPMVRAQAMRALGTSYQAPAGDFLVRGLRDEDVQVRRDAACALVTTWNDSAIPALILHSHPQRNPNANPPDGEPDEQVRIFCVRALAHFNTPEVALALINAMSDNDAAVVQYAQRSLVAVSGQNFSYDLRAWNNWYRETHAPATAPAAQTQP